MTKEQEKILKNMIYRKRINYLLLASVLPYGLAVWKKVLTKRNFNDLLEINDGYAVVYRSYNVVVNEFIQYKLKPCMFMLKFSTKIWQLGNNYITSLSTDKHKVLNSYRTTKNSLQSFEDNEDKYLYNYYSSFCENDLQTNIFYLKIKGYTNDEIAQQLKITRRKVEYNLYVIRKKYQSNNIYI